MNFSCGGPLPVCETDGMAADLSVAMFDREAFESHRLAPVDDRKVRSCGPGGATAAAEGGSPKPIAIIEFPRLYVVALAGVRARPSSSGNAGRSEIILAEGFP